MQKYFSSFGTDQASFSTKIFLQFSVIIKPELKQTVYPL